MPLVTNTLSVNFTPPSVVPLSGYRVKYRSIAAGGAYTTLTPFPTTSPAVITGLDGSITAWEGTIESDCSGTYSTVATFSTAVYCHCVPTYSANSFNTGCERITTVAATSTGGGSITACHFTDTNYGQYGVVFYQPAGYGTNGAFTTTPTYLKTASIGGSYTGTMWANPSSTTTDGRLNRTGIWKCADQTYSTNPLGFARQINIATTKQYYIAVGSDNYASIKVNGVLIVDQNASAMATALSAGVDVTFKYWHVYPVTLSAGSNILEITGTNTGSVGVFGCEIYDATQSQLLACVVESDLLPYIKFSTGHITSLGAGNYVTDGDPFDGGNYNCNSHPGYALIYDTGSSSYKCKLIETDPCGGTP